MILVVGSVVAAPGRVAEVLALSRAHVLRSRAEPGCVAHAVHVDAENPDRLVFVEQWADADALRAHFALAESRAFAAALGTLAAGLPELAIYEATPQRWFPAEADRQG